MIIGQSPSGSVNSSHGLALSCAAHGVVPDPKFRFHAGKLELDVGRRTLRKGGDEVHLSPIEFDMLHYMMEHRELPLDHSKLLRAIWGPEYGQEYEYLRTYVRMIRRKIEDNPARPEYILTEPWLGYRFHDPANPQPAVPAPERPE